MLRYKKIGITAKSEFDAKEEIVERIIAIMEGLGADISVDDRRLKGLRCSKEYPHLGSFGDIDLLVIIGGDGTILRTVREMPDLSIPILSINRGAVGFLAETNLGEAEELIPLFLSGGGIIEERQLLDISVEREGKEVFCGRALNEAVITQGAIARLLDLRACIGGEMLTTYRADGLIIATPTGSTAYSLAAGGPIVHPRLEAIILTAINPHSFSQRPIVIPANQTIDIEVLKKDTLYVDSEVNLTLDGQIYEPVQRFDHVIVRASSDHARFLRRSGDTFYATLRDKLKWGERPEA